ncbi:MAG: DUF6339 family protein [Sulfobacillus sp.]
MYRLTDKALNQIRSNVEPNLSRYKATQPWIDDYLAELQMPFCVDCGLSIALPALVCENTRPKPKDDLANCMALYGALRGIPRTFAADERFWTYHTHVTYWKYMAQRWPPTTAATVRDRYCFTSNTDRGVVRNGLSRLWWMGQVSFDGSRTDPFELTRVLTLSEDLMQQLLEHSFARNPRTMHAILEGIWQSLGGRDSPDREAYRAMLKKINRIGAIRLVDAIHPAELRSIVSYTMVAVADAESDINGTATDQSVR